ncbi:MAG TPA: hypothetical protein VEZ14_12795 [Dehalococcoidia bacterium]|nr:hypothetical protein [Dehalococcoidia bacterium]
MVTTPAETAGRGIEAERDAIAVTAGPEEEARAAEAARDGRVFSSLFRRFVTFGLAGALISLTLLMIAVGIARLAGAATASWTPSAMIASVVAGFEVFGLGSAMLALPSLTEINA